MMKIEKDKNNINFLKIIYAVVFIFSLSLSFLTISNNAEAAIVKCGIEKDNPATTENEAYEGRCTLCDLIIGIKDIIDWGRNILIIVALAIITIGGVVYIISAGNEQMMETAKHIIIQALWGTVIMLGAWLIVNTAMWLLAAKDNTSVGGALGVYATSWDEFNCGAEQSPPPILTAKCGTSLGVCDPGSPSTPYQIMPGKWKWTCSSQGRSVTCFCENGTCWEEPSPIISTCTSFTYSEWSECIDDVQTRTVISSSPAGCTGGSPITSQACGGGEIVIPPGASEEEIRAILEAAGISINKDPCTATQTTNCTDVGGLREYTIQGVIALKKACSTCNIIITGGSESHSSGTYSHANGYKVDLRPSPNLDNYITNNYTSVPSAFGGYPSYRDQNRNLYVREGDHWDVCYGCP